MKLVILDGHTLNPGDLSWAELENLCELKVYDRTEESQIIERVGDAELVFTNKTPLSASMLNKLPKLKYIGVLATGYNVVDTAAANSLGIVVTNIPTYGTIAVAQFVFALLLEICHHVGKHSDAVKENRWTTSADFCFWDYPLIELAGKTLGIIGFGRIGQSTAKIAQAFGMKVLANDAYKDLSLESDTLRYVEIDELFSESDVISLHCPLFESTMGIINKENIDKMKDGVIIINTSRGPLIVEKDLYDGLESGKIFAAGIDVVSTEPINEDNLLLKAKNCIITPHIAWAPIEARQRLLNIAVQNTRAFIANEPINTV
ncbi:MAG: D-2-hydroxyacid dehydrogenase [Vallitaleaceae bacterium]|nr:D-2-hydroxyacid dehydrogenase [Vallitaleaceae bacterium]